MSDEKKIGFGDMYLAPASHTRGRVDAAMPGTNDIALILKLELPPIDPELVSYNVDDDERDYGPDPIAEFSLTADAKGVFAPVAIGGALTPDLRRDFATPTFYVRTPAGRATFMQSADAPSQAVAVIAGWRLDDQSDVDRVAAGAEKLGNWLMSRDEGFPSWRIDRSEIAARHERARRILSVGPDHVSVVVWPKRENDRFDGKKVWRTLHSMGLQWGDGDQFHWNDSTGQTDYLFSAEVDDGELGYALPERISVGQQHFDVIRFGFTVPRTPFPLHVLGQMISAAQATALELDGQIAPCIDGVVVSRTEELALVVQKAVDELASLGVKPGSSSVCILR
jgi:hypothetical protein